MSDITYFLVKHGFQIIGRMVTTHPAFDYHESLYGPYLKRWYRDYPEARLERDPDQTNDRTWRRTASMHNGRSTYVAGVKRTLRRILEQMSKEDLRSLVDE